MDITIYTTPTCGFCHMAKEYLKKLGLEYEEIDITNNGDGLKWVLNKTGQAGVPVIRIGETIIIGFDRPEIDAAVKSLKK